LPFLRTAPRGKELAGKTREKAEFICCGRRRRGAE